MNRMACFVACALAFGLAALGARAESRDVPQSDGVHGPYNVEILAGGDGIVEPLEGYAANAQLPGRTWTLYAWINVSETPKGRAPVAGFGDAAGGRFLALDNGKLAAWTGGDRELASDAAMAPGQWHFVAVVADGGSARLYLDGNKVADGALAQADAAAAVALGPRGMGAAFGGRIAGFTEEDRALSDADIAQLAAQRPDFGLIVFRQASPHWPVQVRQMYGQKAPQEPWTLPKSKAPFSKPVARPAYDGPALKPDGDNRWTLAKWTLAAAPDVTAQGAALSEPGYDTHTWYAATVPGTVLQTLIDRGVYPDPDYGLNNMAIPESLAHQDYWYRTEFVAPARLKGRHLLLTFNGINYAAEIWVNGARIGDIKGAFIRGRFDVTAALKPGQANAIAVKVSPPPHPGIAEEESLSAGVGENGGMEALDGPTFIASEGWDWIPSVRDRDTGLWQDVTLEATGAVRIGDVQVVTTLPKPDNSVADVEIDVPVTNLGRGTVSTTVRARFDDVAVARTVRLKPGATMVKFTQADFPQLSVRHPKLWWPNGYGAPNLHMLHVTAGAGAVSDAKDVRFGMRQITYNLSLIDDHGNLDRVNLDFSKARQLGQQIVDARHRAIRKIPGGWAYSLAPGAENSPAVTEARDTQLTPFLVIKVNGVKIAARGGSWGTDDWLKRVSRARLEPYFRLHRDAHVNIIRNWVGQNTEPVFYDLADEYGILVLNDFWESTQDYQLEAEDVPLFLANAADTIARYRNHPSIVLWFGRNEGVPQPVLNHGLEKLVRTLDGTRIYMPCSNDINLHPSGPYSYQDPAKYFTEFSKGFAVEVGSPSFPTLEAFEAAVPAPDRWPVSDVWAYHDWHPDGNGATKSFTDAMAAKFGPATSLPDFARKAQMMNYETYRAIFEGMNAGLWTENSGRLLWMTQPAWPSTMWQILSHDYDTHAAYYGFKEAAEPVHVQMNLPDHRLAVVNNTLRPIEGAVLHATVTDLAGKTLAVTSDTLDAPPNQVTNGRLLDLAPALAANGVVTVELQLRGADGALLSRNFYWVAKDDASSRKLSAMSPQPVTLSAGAARQGDEMRVTATLRNTGTAPAIEAKLTLLDTKGARILPAYYEDNYISLLPGEARTVAIRYPASAGAAQIALRGWDVAPTTVSVSEGQ